MCASFAWHACWYCKVVLNCIPYFQKNKFPEKWKLIILLAQQCIDKGKKITISYDWAFVDIGQE